MLNKSSKDALIRIGPPARKRMSCQRWLILVVLFFPITVFAMDFFRYCVFSDVEGRVVLNGKPIANATIERGYSFDADKFKIDKATTDANGYFRLPAIYRYSLLTLLPGEMNIYQEMWIKNGDEKFEAWRLTKHRPLELDSELPDEASGDNYDPKTYDSFANYPKRKIKLICDLAKEPSWKERYLGGRNRLFGVCTVVKEL